MDTHISMRPNKAKCSQMWQNTLKWGKIQWNEATQYQIGRNGLLGCSVMSWLMCHQIQIHKRREFQTQFLHYFAKTDNKSNHDHQVGQKSVLCGQLWTKIGIASESERQFASANHNVFGCSSLSKMSGFLAENNDELRPHPFPPSLQRPLILVTAWVGVPLRLFFGGKIVTGVRLTPLPPPRSFEGMGMGMGIHRECQTRNDSLTIRECHSPNGKGNDHRWLQALFFMGRKRE